MIRLLLSFVVVLILSENAFVQAQSFYAIRRERSLMVSAGAGAANYFGELTNPGSLGTIKPGLNVGIEHYLTNRIAARTEITFFQISGSDKNADDSRIVRNLSFVSNNIEFNAAATIDLLPHGLRFYQRPVINFYAFLGVGLTYINPKTEYNGQLVALQPLQTEGVKYSKIQPIIPFGGGIKLKAGPFFNFAFEGGMRKTFTDYMDDISVHSYPDPASLSSDIARDLSNRSGGAASVRGNPSKDDWYFMMTAKVQYYLPYDFGNANRRKLYTKKRKGYNSRGRRKR